MSCLPFQFLPHHVLTTLDSLLSNEQVKFFPISGHLHFLFLQLEPPFLWLFAEPASQLSHVPSSGHLIQRSPHDSYGLSQRALIGLKLPKYLLTCLASLLTAVLGPCLPFLATLYWLWQLTQNLRWPTGRLLEIWAWERSWSNTTFVLRILWKTHRVYRCPTDPTISHSSSSYVTSWFLE